MLNRLKAAYYQQYMNGEGDLNKDPYIPPGRQRKKT